MHVIYSLVLRAGKEDVVICWFSLVFLMFALRLLLVQHPSKLIELKHWLPRFDNIQIDHDLIAECDVIAVLQSEKCMILSWLAWCLEVNMHSYFLILVYRPLDHIWIQETNVITRYLIKLHILRPWMFTIVLEYPADVELAASGRSHTVFVIVLIQTFRLQWPGHLLDLAAFT